MDEVPTSTLTKGGKVSVENVSLSSKGFPCLLGEVRGEVCVCSCPVLVLSCPHFLVLVVVGLVYLWRLKEPLFCRWSPLLFCVEIFFLTIWWLLQMPPANQGSG